MQGHSKPVPNPFQIGHLELGHFDQKLFMAATQ
jgi:hypothetical protein